MDHCREWFISKANISFSLLAPQWTSIDLWNTILHFPVMSPEKFACLLLFNASSESIKKFSLVDFLKNSSTLDNVDMLKITLDNLQTVYHCIFGPDYRDICSVPKSFIQTNVRLLEIRDFNFILDVFNQDFVNFQIDMRNRNVDVPGSSPLNTHELVIECFEKWFTFQTTNFTHEKEEVYKNRPRLFQGHSLPQSSGSGQGMKRSIGKVLNQISFTILAKKFRTTVSKDPCLYHLCSSLGIQTFGGDCKRGSSCRITHHTWPLAKFERKKLSQFVASLTTGLLKDKVDRDLVLQKI